MKLAYVITRADAVGGATIHVRDLARAMRERGHDVTVLVGGRGPVTEQLEDAGVRFRSLCHLARPVRPLRDLRALAELTAALRDLQPGLVSTHTAKAGWIGRAACARLGLTAIYTPHGWPVGERISAPAGAIFTLAERAAARWSGAIICVSESEKRLALSKRIAPEEKLRVVHNGVHDVAASLRADPGRTPARLCSVARFESPKDHATLLRALAALQSLAWELDLAGDGPLEASTRTLAAELGIAARVRFLGYQRDPAATLAAAQLFVLSSRSEGFPRSVLEALRAGLPVVASDVGGVAEAVTEGGNGVLVPAGNAKALSAALGSMLEDASRRVRMGQAARATYEARFRAEQMIEKTASVYASVLSRTSRTQSCIQGDVPVD
ncbi:MAG: glycosyltransferase family 4 protein [Acidobacteria bacterium]|nr:glycosyltransferase family 4 protein [Acidobacteriota bacterium]